MDSLVRAEMIRWHSPGAAVAVVRRGQVVLARGYGLANVEQNIEVTSDTRFRLGSATKPFTATAVMQLRDAGRLSLDETVAKYLPRLPAAYRQVTVRQLLNHTSGIQRDFRGEMNSLAGDALYRALAISPPAFAPGERAAYSNTNYILLGMLIEAASAQSYGSYLQSRIFRPLGMTATTYGVTTERPAEVATGYEWVAGVPQAISMNPARYGAGDLVSSVSDLAKFEIALSSGRLLSRASLEEMWSPAQMKDGSPAILGADDAGRLLGVGLGWLVSMHFGHPVVHHGGNIDGYSAQIDRFTADGITIIVLTNNEAHAAINVASPVIEAFLAPLDSASAASLGQLGRLAFDASRYAEAASYYAAALDRGETLPFVAFNAARSYALVGDRDRAFSFLDRAARLGYRDLLRLNSEPALAPLRTDPRWSAVVHAVGGG